MTTAWKDLDRTAQQAVEDNYVALGDYDALMRTQSADGEAQEAVGFAALYVYATDPQAPMTEALRSALAADADLRADLDMLLSRHAVYRFPTVAAASSGTIEERSGDGFHLRWLASPVVDGEVYVILEVDRSWEVVPQVLVVRTPDGVPLKQVLPEAVDGTIQFLAGADSDLVCALRDATSELFLQ